ncbi:MAG TPA: two-component system VirA-like sensor kinase [Acetobacteraceae bacterium]|jgi:signal transduction histidine kinase|nr:two-component system VirA-like sensor kinase [Acetobacteraceae bacterium]
MRLPPALIGIPLLVALLTWIALHAVNVDAGQYDRALAALEQFTKAENTLHRDVLAARIGILRNYDPLVHEVDVLDGSLKQLRQTNAGDTDTMAAINRVAASVAEEERLVEQFKSYNALLQNSLAYFGLFSSELGDADRSGRLAPAVSRLAAAMLRFTLDTSPAAAHEVKAELDEFARQFPPTDYPDKVQALLAHGRLLHRILPETDSLLRTLVVLPPRQNEDDVHNLIVGHEAASRVTAHRFRAVLYLISLLLVVLLLYLGLQLRTRAAMLRRRAAFEHAIIAASMHILQAGHHDFASAVERTLGDMAEFLGSDRSYFLLSGSPARMVTWSRPGMSFPAGWPEEAPALATRFNPVTEGVIHVPSMTQLPRGPERDLCERFGLKGWACAWSVDQDGSRALLGFDALRQPYRVNPAGELSLLRMALDTVLNAFRRQMMEQDKELLETRLQQARRMEIIGALASGVAHNFNNIIGAILGYAEMAEAQLPSDGRIARNFEEIRRAGQRARELVGQILTFGRRRDVHREPVSVGAAVTEAASLLRASLPPGTALIIHETPPEAVVLAEPVQLQQLIFNLCTNAAQAMNGHGDIMVETKVQELPEGRSLSHGYLRPGRYVCISVADSGPGIDDATLGRIFEPFVTTRANGNGLGLTTVREVVREYGGAMNVQSAQRQGSRFEAWLPCIVAPEAALAGEARQLQRGHGETVLVVNDNRTQLLRDEEILAVLGYEPVGFTRADDALASCRMAPERFSAAVVGRLVPVGEATAFVAELHRILPELPVIVAMGSVDQIDSETLLSAGSFEVVGQPFAPAEMAAALARALAGPGKGSPQIVSAGDTPGARP